MWPIDSNLLNSTVKDKLKIPYSCSDWCISKYYCSVRLSVEY